MIKPDIIVYIGDRVGLKSAGGEHVGLCPFHPDRHPSLYVNREKQVFLCRACQAAGDVVDFVMRLDGLSFSEACRTLGIESERRTLPALTPSRRRAAELAADWARKQRAKFNFLLIDALERVDLADEIGDSDLGEVFEREMIMLRGFHQGLEHPSSATEMLAARQAIERITFDVEIIDEPPAPFPPLTSEYLAMLKRAVSPVMDLPK